MRKRRLIAGVAVAALLAGACTDDSDEPDSATGDTGGSDTTEVQGGTESEFFDQE